MFANQFGVASMDALAILNVLDLPHLTPMDKNSPQHHYKSSQSNPLRTLRFFCLTITFLPRVTSLPYIRRLLVFSVSSSCHPYFTARFLPLFKHQIKSFQLTTASMIAIYVFQFHPLLAMSSQPGSSPMPQPVKLNLNPRPLPRGLRLYYLAGAGNTLDTT